MCLFGDISLWLGATNRVSIKVHNIATAVCRLCRLKTLGVRVGERVTCTAGVTTTWNTDDARLTSNAPIVRPMLPNRGRACQDASHPG